MTDETAEVRSKRWTITVVRTIDVDTRGGSSGPTASDAALFALGGKHDHFIVSDTTTRTVVPS
jgi:hypothetical protein